MIVFPPFRLDSDQERLWRGDTLLVLRRKPFAILRHLAANPAKLVTHDELLAHVWRGAVVSESSMRSHIHELRQVLGDGVIETVVGRGYRFVARVSTTADESTTQAVADSSTGLTPVADAPVVVGREAELEKLRAALDRARAGRRQLCFVTGEPGIGKTTLVRKFLAELEPSTVVIARGSCFEQHGSPEPYLAIIEAVTSLARSARSAQTVSTLMRYAPTFVAQVPYLVNDEQLAEVTRRAAGGNQARQLRELSEALEALSAQTPVLLVLEDLQWSDVATIDLLSLLGQRQEPAKLLVVGTSRHAEIQSPDHPLNRVLRSLMTRSGALLLHVPRFGEDAVQHFIDRRFAGHVFPEGLTHLVAKITGGTPLFMVSLLEDLAGRGLLAERDGRWALTVALEEVRAHRPASVKQLIDIQLDRLTAAEQRVLEAASIVGTDFSTHLVAAALDLPVEQVDDTCDALVRRSLFLRAEPDARYGVTHALVQEVCLERVSPSRRQRWHLLVAEALERDPRAAELPHLLAQHFEAGGVPARAVPAYLAAARLAGQRYATSDAVALCARALALVPHLAAGRERDLLELQALGTACQQFNANSFSTAFAGREPLSVYARAIELARSLGDAERLYGALTELCNYHMIIAQYDLSAELTAELDQIERAHALDPALLHAGTFARAYIAFFSADLSTALRLLEKLAPPEKEASIFHGDLAGRALALGHLACARWVVGDAERALDDAEATIDIAAKSGVPIMLALGHVVRARLRYLRRDPLALLQEAAERAVQAAALDVGLSTEANAFALWAQAKRGPLTLAAIEPLSEGLRQRLREVATCSTLVAHVLIDVLRLSGHATQARELTDEIIAFAQAHNESVYLPELLRVRGEQLEAADPAAAARDYRQAIALAHSTGARSLERRAVESLTALEARAQG